jgi:hypothetical protein
MEREKLDRRGLVGDSPKHWFGKDNPGRPKGANGKYPKAVRELVTEAMDKLGADGKGKQGALGFVKQIGKKNPTHLLAAAVKMEAAKTVASALAQPEPEQRFRSFEEVAMEIHQRGMSSGMLHHLADKLEAWESSGRHAQLINGAAHPKLLDHPEQPDRRD